MTAARPPRVVFGFAKLGEAKIAVVAFDNQAKLNSLTSAMMADFTEGMAELAKDDDLRAVIVTGAGTRAFSGGVNIDEMAGIDNPEAARSFITGVHLMCDCVRQVPVPVIAKVSGHCYGGALELIAACDLRIAASDARFGMPEVRLGIPSVVEAAMLPMLIGWGRTRRLLYTGETILADQALVWGLVEEVAPPDSLGATVDACLGSILACGPAAIRDQKALMQAWERLPLAEAVAAGIDAFAGAYRSDEPRAMMEAFLAARASRTGAA
jgi:enoyl-CoA hydratase/carnithine racemase